MKDIELTILTAVGCQICKRFEEFWQGAKQDWPNVQYRNIDMVTPEGQDLIQKYMIFASPGIILNGELWATGGFNKEKFIEKLQELSQ